MGIRSTHQYSHTIGFFSLQGGRGFACPVDMVLDSEGLLYVLSRGSSESDEWVVAKRITVCSLSEEYLNQFSSGGIGNGEIMWPSAIAMDDAEKIYVADDALQRISIFNKQGQFLDSWGVMGSGNGEFDRPAGMAFDDDNNLLVVDGLNNRVQRYTRDGQFLGQWGRLGNRDGEFNMPWGITTDRSGYVYVADWRNDRIQKFDADGKHLSSWGTTGDGDGQFYRPSGVAVDEEGTIYVADWGNHRIQILGPDGSFYEKFRGESMLSTWALEYFTTNQDELEEREKANMEPELNLAQGNFSSDESASVEKLFWGPTTVKVDDQGRVFVVDTSRHRIQVFVKDS